MEVRKQLYTLFPWRHAFPTLWIWDLTFPVSPGLYKLCSRHCVDPYSLNIPSTFLEEPRCYKENSALTFLGSICFFKSSLHPAWGSEDHVLYDRVSHMASHCQLFFFFQFMLTLWDSSESVSWTSSLKGWMDHSALRESVLYESTDLLEPELSQHAFPPKKLAWLLDRVLASYWGWVCSKSAVFVSGCTLKWPG